MDASPVLSLLAVITFVAGVLLLLIDRLRLPSQAGANGLARLRGPSGTMGFPSALVTAFAAATALSLTEAAPWQAGALIGLSTAVLSLRVLTHARKILFGAAALAGTACKLIMLFQPVPGCSAAGSLDRWFMILLTTIAALGAGLGWFFGHTPTSPTTYFSTVTVLGFLASPMGVPAFTTTEPALAGLVAVVGAAVFGFAAGRWPAPVIGLAALAIGLTSVAVAALIAPACSAILNGPQLYTLIAFTVVYTLVRAATAWLDR